MFVPRRRSIVEPDERGISRPQGSGGDVGAVEVEVEVATATPVPPPVTPVTPALALQPAFTG